MRFPLAPAPTLPWRGSLAVCALVGIIAGATMGWRTHLGTLKVRRGEATRKAQSDAQQQTMLAQFDQPAPDASLERWLPYTAVAGSPTVATHAQDTIRARPHLTFDLVGCLRRADAPTRQLVFNFVRGGGLPALSVDSIPSACEALQCRSRIHAHQNPSATRSV